NGSTNTASTTNANSAASTSSTSNTQADTQTNTQSPSTTTTDSSPTTLRASTHSPRKEGSGENSRSVRSPLPNSWRTRGGSVKTNTTFSAPTTLQSSPEATMATAAASANLVQNPSVETSGSNGLPQGWNKGGYGTNTRTLTYPVAGTGGATSKAIQVSVSNYTNVDAKWFFNDVAVTGGATYQFSDSSKATVQSIVTVRFLLSDGTYNYKDILTVPASTN